MTAGRDRNRAPYLTLAMTGTALLCVNPGLTQGENHINLLLCAVMCFSPAVLLFRRTRFFVPRLDIPLALVCLLVTGMPLFFHRDTVRLSTMLFTCAYCVYIMMLARLLIVSRLNAYWLMRLIQALVYLFAAVLVIQQLCVLTGMPVFCAAMVYDNPWKLNSLTAEPSHTTVTLCTLMWIYTQTVRLTRPRAGILRELTAKWPLWLCWAWTLFSTPNASAYLLAPLPLVAFVNRSNIWKWTLAAVAGAGLLLGITGISDSQPGRLARTITAIFTLDEQKIIEADASASARIVPTIRGAVALAASSPVELLTGHGVDADIREIDDRPGDDDDDRGFAGIFSMAYNYGLPCALAFWWAIGACTLSRRRPMSILTFIIALQLSADYNMQLVWMVMAAGLAFKQIADQKQESYC